MSGYVLGKRSMSILSSAHPDLINIAKKAISLGVIDFSVIESFRPESVQNRYFQEGKSKVTWPNGKHNKHPSDAVDIVPYVNGKLSWDQRHCLVMAGVILATAKILGIDVRWGGNWDMDGEPVTDQDFKDLVHFERI